MQEIEVKILEVDRKKVEEKLISLGAIKVFDGEIIAIYFDYPDNSLRKAELLLRLRQEGDKPMLALKRNMPHEKVKFRQEYESEVSDLETMRSILELLGMAGMKELKKHRISYKMENARFEFDKFKEDYDFIPEFMEIEAKDEKTVLENAKLLGFDEKDCKPWGFNDLVKHYKK